MAYQLIFTRHSESTTRMQTRSNWSQTTITMYFHPEGKKEHADEKEIEGDDEGKSEFGTDTYVDDGKC